ncbi:hypothetical protein [Olleya sp. Bg11-27]|uniref:hypothetical protein n=1 Tax=Olleya sp. Bg11-27 TaxID=2058135 RepID=UPI000C31479E|nr:hypothetical protein [Olleya sp. Bg11-27]AUC75227.1 hypothetical protein CW732_05870 [Olleya sp. Bg11-27]
MTKTSSKIISIIFGVIAIYFTVNLIPDKTKKKFTALDKQYSFTKEISISEKFKTDFDSAYRIWLNFDNTNDSLLPIKKHLEVLRNGKPIELYGDRNNSFVSESGTKYELKLKLENADGNSSLNKLNIIIAEDNLPGPTYELYFEREYKWVFWTIDGIIISIALITGYFGFRKKASR